MSATSPKEKTADGQGNDEEGDDESPDVGDTRGGCDAVLVVVGNGTVAGDTVMDDMPVVFPHAWISNPSWHNEVIVGAE